MASVRCISAAARAGSGFFLGSLRGGGGLLFRSGPLQETLHTGRQCTGTDRRTHRVHDLLIRRVARQRAHNVVRNVGRGPARVMGDVRRARRARIGGGTVQDAFNGSDILVAVSGKVALGLRSSALACLRRGKALPPRGSIAMSAAGRAAHDGAPLLGMSRHGRAQENGCPNRQGSEDLLHNRRKL